MVEALPLKDNSFGMILSNGVLNPVPDKDKAFSESHRELKPGGTFMAADLLVTEIIPEEVLGAWMLGPRELPVPCRVEPP